MQLDLKGGWYCWPKKGNPSNPAPLVLAWFRALSGVSLPQLRGASLTKSGDGSRRPTKSTASFSATFPGMTEVDEAAQRKNAQDTDNFVTV
jgi:hypothetical protein